MSLRSRRGAVAVALALASCAPSRDAHYARLEASAERAYSAGRYDEAAARWAEAAEAAERSPSRDEARYREAESLLRAGKTAEADARLAELVRASPHGDRAARAVLDRARLKLASGDEPGARALFETELDDYPASGVAPDALRERLRTFGDDEAARRAFLDARLPRLERTELGQYLHTEYAASLARSGQLEAAHARYLLVAERYPYPAGGLWDDALFHASELSVQLGAPARAVLELEQLLGEREGAFANGSYERPRYAEARYRVGELYRDALHDPVRARQEFERLWTEHRESRLRDDAAWAAARLAVRSGDQDGACRDLRALTEQAPTSRYVACVRALCPLLPAANDGHDCHPYLLRSGETP